MAAFCGCRWAQRCDSRPSQYNQGSDHKAEVYHHPEEQISRCPPYLKSVILSTSTAVIDMTLKSVHDGTEVLLHGPAHIPGFCLDSERHTNRTRPLWPLPFWFFCLHSPIGCLPCNILWVYYQATSEVSPNSTLPHTPRARIPLNILSKTVSMLITNEWCHRGFNLCIWTTWDILRLH